MKLSTLFLSALLLASGTTLAQADLSKVLQNTNTAVLDSLSAAWAIQMQNEKEAAIAVATQLGMPLKSVLPDGRTIALRRLSEDGTLLYYVTHNTVSAASIHTNRVHNGGGAGLSLEGSGMTIGEWDGGAVLLTHEQLSGRVVQTDGATSLSDHAIHVCGTLIGDGIGTGGGASSAKGMAPQAQVSAHDWNLDQSEMATAAAGGLLVSNHSYGYNRGYSYSGFSGSANQWTWWGGSAQYIGGGEEPAFGKYTDIARDWDIIAVNAPYYLIVKAAGNERNDNPGGTDQVQDGFSGTFATYNPAIHPGGDGTGNGGYDNIGDNGNSKNVLTVAAVEDVPVYSGAGSVGMSSFSSWGPTDDGRIKPDISANGVNLTSSVGPGNSDYDSYSGTSMSSPSVTGSAILLQEHFENTHGAGNFMRAATLKGLIIHTADEAGTAAGPDYQFGWGLMNTERAAQVITDDVALPNTISENSLNSGGTFTMEVTSDGTQPLIVTISWTDPAATASPYSNVDEPTSRLVNDLDMGISLNASTWSPYMLNPANPANAATTGDNDRDNVEKIYLGTPAAGTYTITITHEGALTGGSQNFSLLISGGEGSGGGGGGDISNPSVCQLNLTIPDFSCDADNQFAINVATAPGTQLGTDVYLKEVKLVIAHTWTADLSIRLHSPQGVTVDLSLNNGGPGDHYGDPNDLTCASVTTFRMSAATSITAGAAPFIGAFIPQGDFADFEGGGNPIGTWTLELCDGFPDDIGILKFVNLVFAPLIPNPSPCQMALFLPDISCGEASSHLINVESTPGTQLGTDVFLKEVKLLVEHTFDGDLDIRLRSPNGVTVNLTVNNGGSGDNFGNPGNLSCASVTTFSMDAPTSITAGTAPFIGSFIPQGDFADFDDGSDPVGRWTIELCDDYSGDVGYLRFVELVFSPLLSNPSACQLGYSLPDVSCGNANRFPVNVTTASGTQLGADVALTNVKLILSHTYDGDLDIRLRSPNGVTVSLAENNGGSGDNFGNPSETTCSSFTNFSMSASTPITAGTAPFIGSYIPMGNFADFNDGSSPIGLWTLEICDEALFDVGTLVFAELVFGSASGGAPGCTALAYPVNGQANVPANAALSWASASGNPTGYLLSVGTSPGGSEILHNLDVGFVTSFDPPGYFPYSATIYVRVSPYNGNGVTSGCGESSFITGSCIANLNVVSIPVDAGLHKSLGDLLSHTSTVANGTAVVFTSNTGVLLNYEFVVEAGGVFEVNIQGCGN